MREQDVLDGAFAMPRTSPSCPLGPYRFVGRDYLTIAYRTDAQAPRRRVPEPLVPRGEEARLQFIRMPDSTGFGDDALATQVIPVRLPDGMAGGYIHAMRVDAHTANSGAREVWGFPQKLARPSLSVERDTLLGQLDVGPVAVARGSMGFKHRVVPQAKAMAERAAPGGTLKIIPHVDGRPRICELVRYRLSDIVLKGGWTGPAALEPVPRALAPGADLPVHEAISATHPVADLTLDLVEVVHDDLNPDSNAKDSP
jgi:acetoacetate decarboxylase